MRMLYLVAALALPGCFLDESVNLNEGKQAIEGWNRLATNRLATNRLATNRLATNRLATNSLGELIALPETADILDNEDGRVVYSYLVGCALPFTEEIVAQVPGAANTGSDSIHSCVDGECRFPGALGLVPTWRDQALDDEGKGWISACIFARINVFETAEAISLRGANPGLAVTTDEAELFTVQEGAFFGDLFTAENKEIDWNACRGEGQASSEEGGLALRDCTEPDPANPGRTVCGFNYAGDCRDFTQATITLKGYGPRGGACRSYDTIDGHYSNCRAKPGKNSIFPVAITTYVTQ